ncbi:hypothetical protein F2P81_023238 [Scophthalmus maximus]|uniref:Uncharacterized protein n=1 Tax=Scophthalmus maximus TaxID=52904 RepID=A0A6A4RPE9_SCOMX|nr:hypothetical protein F2P81_023238 [Scophthalmus maximus]
MEGSTSKTVPKLERPRNRDAWLENQELQEEMRKLKHWLGLERDWRIQLLKELGYKAKCSTEEERKNLSPQVFEDLQVALENNMALLEEQKPLRASYQEMSGKYDTDTVKQQDDDLQCELKKETESNADTLSPDQLLMAEKDDCCQKMAEELQVQKEKNMVLQEELDTLRASYHELRKKYEDDLNTVRRQADDLQCELEKKIESHTQILSQDHLLMQNLMAEQDDCCQKTAEELQVQKEKNMVLQEELETLRASYQEISEKYETYFSTARQQTDDRQCEHENEIESHANTLSQDQLLMQNLRDEQEDCCQKMAEEPQVQNEKNMALQEELERLRASYQELSQRYETDVNTVRQQADNSQCEHGKEIESHTDMVAQDQLLMQKEKNMVLQEVLETLRASYQELSQRYETNLSTVMQKAENIQHDIEKDIESHTDMVTQEQLLMQKEKNMVLQEELEKLSASYQELSQRYETDLSTVMQKADDFQRELEKEIESHTDMVTQDQFLMQKEKNMVLQEELDTVSASYQELRQRFETDLSTVMQRADDFERQLEKEIESNRDMVSQDQLLLQNEKNMVLQELETVRASYQELSQRYETDITTVMQKADDFQLQLKEEIKSHTDMVPQDQLLMQSEKNMVLQEELNTVRASYQELSQRYETDITTVMQKADDFQLQLEKEIESHTDMVSQDQLLMQSEKNMVLQEELDTVRASYQELSQKYETDISSVMKKADDFQLQLEKEIESHTGMVSQDQHLMQREKNMVLQEELDTVRASYQELSQRYETDLTTIMQKSDDFQLQLEKEIESHIDMVSQDQHLMQREKNMVLQEELDTVRASYQELSQRYETDLSTVMQKADDFQREIKKEIQSHTDMVSQDQLLMQREKNMGLQKELETVTASYQELSQRYETDVVTVSKQAGNIEKENDYHADMVRHLRAEKDALGEKMVKKMTLLQKNAAEQEMLLRKELEELKSQLTTTVKAQRDKNHPPRVELTSEVPDKTPIKTKKASPCKRVQKCFTLRKPQSRKMSKDPAPNTSK